MLATNVPLAEEPLPDNVVDLLLVGDALQFVALQLPKVKSLFSAVATIVFVVVTPTLALVPETEFTVNVAEPAGLAEIATAVIVSDHCAYRVREVASLFHCLLALAYDVDATKAPLASIIFVPPLDSV